LLGLSAVILVIILSAQPASAKSRGHHQSQSLKSDCVTLNMPRDAVEQLLTDTSATRRHLQDASDVMASLEDLKTGQQLVKSVLLEELQAKVLGDLESSEVIQHLQRTQKQQTQMLHKMQTLLETISEQGIQHRPKPNSNELVIHSSTLEQKLQSVAINKAIEAVEQYSEYEDICPFIMSALEEEHNKYWECTVGRDYAAWVMANSGQFLKFSLGDLTFRIFRVLP